MSLSSCNKDFWVKGEGPVVSEQRQISGFNAVHSGSDIQVVLTKDTVFYVEVQAQANILPKVETYVAQGELYIDLDNHIRRHDGITVYVHMPLMKGIYISGSGDVRSVNTFSGSDVYFESSGSGSIDVDVTCSSIYAEVSGSGKISLGGSATREDFRINGSGNIRSFGLLSQQGDVRVSGSGDVEINASSSLNVHISGSGDVRYIGNPTMNTEISGSGSVVHVN